MRHNLVTRFQFHLGIAAAACKISNSDKCKMIIDLVHFQFTFPCCQATNHQVKTAKSNCFSNTGLNILTIQLNFWVVSWGCLYISVSNVLSPKTNQTDRVTLQKGGWAPSHSFDANVKVPESSQDGPKNSPKSEEILRLHLRHMSERGRSFKIPNTIM